MFLSRRKKKTESGRSLVEVLGVILVITILTVTALWGYKKIVNRATANAVGKMITTLAMERRQKLLGSNVDTEDLQTVKGPMGIELKVKNGTAGDGKDYFSIEVDPGSVGLLCEELKNLNFLKASEDGTKTTALPSFVTVGGSLNGSCPAPLVFYYSKSPQNDPGSMVYIDESGNQQVCPENAICKNGKIVCPSGHFKLDGDCVVCPADAVTCTEAGFTCPEGTIKATKKCVNPMVCDYPAVDCDENGDPTACADGYYLKNKQCLPCTDSHAITCNSRGKATQCEDGYCLHNGSCDKLPDNASCTSSSFECKTGYYKTGSTCTPCPSHYATCSSSGFTCQAGYYKNEGTCTQCGNRQISSAGGECTTCTTPGKTNNSDHMACTENCSAGDEYCGCSGDTPYADGNGGCTGSVCPAGTKYDGEECKNCMIGETCGCSGDTPYSDGAGGCFANFSCPEHSSLDLVEGQQIENSVCYCEEGYVPGALYVTRDTRQLMGKSFDNSCKNPSHDACTKKCSSNNDCGGVDSGYFCGKLRGETVCLYINNDVCFSYLGLRTNTSVLGKEIRWTLSYTVDYWTASNWCSAQTINGKPGQLLDMSSNPFECYKNETPTKAWSWPNVGQYGYCCAYNQTCRIYQHYRVGGAPFASYYGSKEYYSEKFKSFLDAYPVINSMGNTIRENSDFWIKNQPYALKHGSYAYDWWTGEDLRIESTTSDDLLYPLCE